MTDVFFFDSYALIEVLRGNENYFPFKEVFPCLTKLNLFEVYYALSREVGETEAEKFLRQYAPYVVDFDELTISEAAKLKLALKEKRLSMADVIGYQTAKRLEIKFLTGDKEFQHLENVEYVK